MTSLAVLFAALALAGEPAHHAQHHAAAAAQHEAEHEQKLVEQAAHRQMEYEQHVMREQQKAVHEQMKAQLHAQAEANAHAAHPSTVVKPHEDGYAGRPYGGVTRPYYGGSHHSYHNRGSHHYRNHNSWPMATDPELAGLQHLRQTIEGVHAGQTVTSAHKQALERALMRVVEVNRPPSVASMNRLAGHLGDALAGRSPAHLDAQSLALELRAGVNAPHLINAERVAVQNKLQGTLKAAQVRPADVTTVLAALKAVEHQEQARR